MYTATCIKDVKKNNKLAGYCFFHPKVMSFWGSKIETELLSNNTFVTSERTGYDSSRRYTVRYYDPQTAYVDNIGEYGVFQNRKDAIKFAQQLT